jgi:hypothetical protein
MTPEKLDPVQLAGWIGCLAFLVILVNGLFKLAFNVKQKPAPGDVQKEAMERYVAKEEFRAHVAENKQAHDRFDVRIGGVDRSGKDHISRAEQTLREERTEDMRRLHSEINDLNKKVAAVETEARTQNAWLTRIDSKIDALMAKEV